MQDRQPLERTLSRRQLLRVGLMGSCGLALAACSSRLPTAASPTIIPAPTDTPGPIVTPTPAPSPTARPGPKVIVGDVLDYALNSDEWPGAFGWVTFRLTEVTHEGESAYLIRTDASDETYAREHGLVWAPLLLGANEGPIANIFYQFEDDRPPVIRSIPGQPDFLSLFEIVVVRGGAEDRSLTSARAIQRAADRGEVSLEPSGIYVNYPVVKWPGGELPVDDDLTTYLGTGQLLEPVDTAGMTVTFKLHEGYPGDRYITVDTSAVELAPNMHIAPSAASWATVEHYATDEVFVFANGLPGSGVMGLQPAVFGSAVDSLVWSPFWNHFTVRWINEGRARLLRNADEVYDAIQRGELEKFNGLPDTHPNGFVVNCPIPVLADNTL